VILGASYDTVEENRAFAEKFDFPYDLLCDTDQALAKAYGAFNPEKPGYPRRITYVIDGEGRIAHAFDEVTPKTHVAEVLAALGGP